MTYIKEYVPDAKIYFHQTWAYETDSLHEGFSAYSNNQEEMFSKILLASERFSKEIDVPIIPTGRVVQHLRKSSPEFDYEDGGISLCRDGFHLSYDYGRYTASAVWLRVLTGKKLSVFNFEDFDTALTKKIISTVNEIVQ